MLLFFLSHFKWCCIYFITLFVNNMFSYKCAFLSILSSIIKLNLFIRKSKLKYEELGVRLCKRRTFLCFVVLRNTKHGKFQNFRMYQKYWFQIFFQNNRFNLNHNQISYYDYRMQGLSWGKNFEMFKESRISPTVFVHKSACVWGNNLREMIFVWEIYFR